MTFSSGTTSYASSGELKVGTGTSAAGKGGSIAITVGNAAINKGGVVTILGGAAAPIVTSLPHPSFAHPSVDPRSIIRGITHMKHHSSTLATTAEDNDIVTNDESNEADLFLEKNTTAEDNDNATHVESNEADLFLSPPSTSLTPSSLSKQDDIHNHNDTDFPTSSILALGGGAASPAGEFSFGGAANPATMIPHSGDVGFVPDIKRLLDKAMAADDEGNTAQTGRYDNKK